MSSDNIKTIREALDTPLATFKALEARAYQASRAREARLEALVRTLGECARCDAGQSWELQKSGVSKPGRCTDCAGTGLVEAAREELKDG